MLAAEPDNAQIRAIAAQAALEGGMVDEGRALLAALAESTISEPRRLLQHRRQLPERRRDGGRGAVLRRRRSRSTPPTSTPTSSAASATSSWAGRPRPRRLPEGRRARPVRAAGRAREEGAAAAAVAGGTRQPPATSSRGCAGPASRSRARRSGGRRERRLVDRTAPGGVGPRPRADRPQDARATSCMAAAQCCSIAPHAAADIAARTRSPSGDRLVRRYARSTS